MYQLYIANKNYSSWSLRPWLLMRELRIDFEEKLVPFEGVASATKFRTFSPSGRVPCLVDGDTTVWDSLAITEYVAEQHPTVWPRDSKARAWARSAAAEMHSGFATLRNICGMNCGIRVRLNNVAADLQNDVRRIQELWNDGLTHFGGPFLAGREFTAADAFFAPVAFRVQTYGLTLDQASMSYVDRLLNLSGMMSWYEAALKETWRDEPHDADSRAVGEWTQDLRAV